MQFLAILLQEVYVLYGQVKKYLYINYVDVSNQQALFTFDEIYCLLYINSYPRNAFIIAMKKGQIIDQTNMYAEILHIYI